MPEHIPSKKPEVEETLQFLKREEVRTMAKDIAKLREQEASEERAKIAKTKTEEKPQPIPPSLMPHEEKRRIVLPRARTRFQKVFIRVIIVGILLFVVLNGLALGYWYFTRKAAVEITPEPAPATEIEEPIVQPPASTPSPVVFFETPQEKAIDLGTADNVIPLLSEALKEEYQQGFTRILIKKGDAFLTAREFFNSAGITVPETLLSLLKDDFMLFAYASPGRLRLGIIAELSQIADTEQERSTEGVQDMMRSWEATLEQDTKSLWEIVGQKGSAYTTLFRQTAYQNSQVRFQTFSVLDFGVVYTVFDTKLVLTTSFESLTRAVDQIMQSRQ